ncbi:uncharacterized protein PRCAT00005074001 [Priceomyces carsonii]|uniref:uncharacterized protein n=1 Tax=Priceomyces carsonii TaxID=28549 RepID=UPI002ED92686|nr:unnamed protein product [Priceomyces carsonii]
MAALNKEAQKKHKARLERQQSNGLRLSACDRCRRRKIKCDQRFPKCSKCESANVECYALDSLTGRKIARSYIFHLEYKIGILENIMKLNNLKIEDHIKSPLEYKVPNAAFNNDKETLLAIVSEDDDSLNESKDDLILFNMRNPESSRNRLVKIQRKPFNFLMTVRRDPANNISSKMSGLSGLKNFDWRKFYFENEKLNKVESEMRNYFGDLYIELIHKDPSVDEISKAKSLISRIGLKRGLSYSRETLESLDDVLVKVRLILPTKNVLLALVAIFFKNIYPFFPLLDETSFRNDLNRIVKFDEKGNPLTPVPEDWLDYAFLSLMLILLRLSYISVFNNADLNNDEIFEASRTIGTIIQNPIPLESIELSKLCLRKYDLVSIFNLKIFQAVVFMKIYKCHAPEDCEVSDLPQSQIYHEILISMAESLELNRDPDILEIDDEKEKHLRRKLWYFLVWSDMEDSIVYGTPVATFSEKFNTKSPIFETELTVSNIWNVSLETSIMANFRNLSPITSLLHSVVEKVFKVSPSLGISDLVSLVSKLEALVEKNFESLEDYFTKEDSQFSFQKIIRFKLHLYCKTFLLYINYCIALSYEFSRSTNLHHFFLKKLLDILYLDLSIINAEIFTRAKSAFGSQFTLIITPVIQIASRYLCLINSIMSIRISSSIHLLKNENFKKKAQFQYSVNRNLDLLDEALNSIKIHSAHEVIFNSLMSKRYYSSWKCKKNFRLIFENGLNPELYNDESCNKKVVLKLFWNDLEDMLSIWNSSIPLKKKLIDKYMSKFYHQCKGILPDQLNEKRTEENSIDTSYLNDLHSDSFWFQLERIKEIDIKRQYLSPCGSKDKAGSASLQESSYVSVSNFDSNLGDLSYFEMLWEHSSEAYFTAFQG